MPAGLVGLANDLLPPALLRLLRRVRRPPHGFFGRYASYAEAASAAGGAGYADAAMIDALVRNQLELVGAPGPVAVEDRWLHLQLALSQALQGATEGALKVLDFGGGAGVHYFDVVRWRERSGWPAAALSWHVCETAPMAAAAQAALGGEELTFYDSLDRLDGAFYDLVYVSGSLPYVPDAQETWTRLAGLPHRWLALTRTPFIAAAADVYAVQRAPIPGGGRATYAGRFLAERPWLDRIARTHDLVARWPVHGHRPYVQALRDVRYEGMLLRRR